MLKKEKGQFDSYTVKYSIRVHKYQYCSLHSALSLWRKLIPPVEYQHSRLGWVP